MAIEYSALNLSAARGFLFAINEPLTLYVATDGDNETNTGLSIDSPWATPHRALKYLADKFIADGAIVTIKCAAGNYLFNENIVVAHPCGDRIAIVGANPLELTLAQVDGYHDTTGKTGSDTTGSEVEGGLVSYPLGCNRTGIHVATGKTGEDILYDTDGVADANAYGERFAMVCTVSGATAALTTDDTYVLIRGFSGGYESSNSTITDGTTADTSFTVGSGTWGEGSAGRRYPSLNMANKGRDASAVKRPAGDNFAFFKSSTDLPTNNVHNNRYPYWREPENYTQRFLALGCHKITGIGKDTPGLNGATGQHLARITVENKNTNRNPWGKDEFGFTPDSTTPSFAANNTAFDYDLPTPKTKPGTDLDTNDSVGYDPHATQGARPSVGVEDTGFGSDPQTHGVFTVTGVRTIFTFSKDCTFKFMKSEEDRYGSKYAVFVDSPGLYRLDNIIIRPEIDLATANANEWGVPSHDNNGSIEHQHKRENFGGIGIRPHSTISHLGPNIGITDFPSAGISNSGTLYGMGIIIQNNKRGVSIGGRSILYNATILSNPEENLRVEQNHARCSLVRSFVMGSGKHVWARNGAGVVAVDTAFLYGMQYHNTNNPITSNGVFRFDRNTTGEVSRCFMHRSGNGFEVVDNSSLILRYCVNQEPWQTSYSSRGNSHMNLSWCASIKARSCGIYCSDRAVINMSHMFISGTAFNNVLDHNGTNVASRGIQLYCAASMFVTGHVVIYNGYDGHAVQASHGNNYIQMKPDSGTSTTNFWIHYNLGQQGEGSSDTPTYGPGNPYMLYAPDGDETPYSHVGTIRTGSSPGVDEQGTWYSSMGVPLLTSDFSTRPGISYT
jgi:hypothetical protein